MVKFIHDNYIDGEPNYVSFKLKDSNLLEILKCNGEEVLKEKLNSLISVKRNPDFVFYNIKRNWYKNQVYLNGKYFLTTDKLNNESLKWDYKLLRCLGLYNEDIKKVLKRLYIWE